MSAAKPPNRGGAPGSADISAQTLNLMVRFWGVRGTLPTPGPSTLRYGGNTSCVEVMIGNKNQSTVLVLDAGSGIAGFGETALRRGDRSFHILLSHMHYDHIMGLTRFAPLFREDCKIHFYGQAKCGFTLQQILEKLFSFPFFPVPFASFQAEKRLFFHEINNLSCIFINGVRIDLTALHHPQDAVAFRIWNTENSLSVVYATDHEHGSKADDSLSDFAQDSSLLLYDSTYTTEDYPRFQGWGHSTAAEGAKLAKRANVGAFGIFHHDPQMSDDELEARILPEAQHIFTKSFLCAETQRVDVAKLLLETQWKDALLFNECHSNEQKSTKRRIV